jgi:hypothetical protein
LPVESFTLTAQPAALMGKCLRNCATDTDCIVAERCAVSAGLAQKTCRPK